MGKSRHDDVALAYSMAFDRALFHRHAEEETRKGGLVKAPNAYVFFAARRLDSDFAVEKFRHGNVRFEYWHPDHWKIEGSFFDFDVRMVDGSRKLVFVTPQFYLNTAAEQNMIEAGEMTAKDLRARMEVWTEIEIFGPNPAYMRSVILYIMDRLWETQGLEREVSDEAEDFGSGDARDRRGAPHPGGERARANRLPPFPQRRSP